jgi:uncharacterized protein YgiM (DUF1202 family)
MRKAVSTILFTFFAGAISHINANPESASAPNENTHASFSPFTGKITRDKVRLRSQAALDGSIVKELNKGDLLIVSGETDDFYAVQPPTGTKAYIFRTYVLDDTVEGNHVNVRLEPSVDSPIIAQLNSGEHVQGAISQQNNKWLEIIAPPSTRFYVSKDYVEKIGDQNLLVKLERRALEADHLTGAAIAISQKEMQKPFDQINIEVPVQNFNKVISEYSDFPDKAQRAKSYLTTLQENYLQKKIAYLEEKSKQADNWQSKTDNLKVELQAQQQRFDSLQQKMENQVLAQNNITIVEHTQSTPSTPQRLAVWIPFENVLYEHWKNNQPDLSWDEFYHLQQQNAVTLKGIIEPYNRTVKNKPGDFVLVSKLTNLPIAYLYSTKVNLLDKVGQEVVIEAYSRPNNNFAFPAYFVLSIN